MKTEVALSFNVRRLVLRALKARENGYSWSEMDRLFNLADGTVRKVWWSALGRKYRARFAA